MRDVILVFMLLAAKLITAAVWIGGIVIASGFWSTLFAFFVPPWALYLVAEKAMQAWGWI